MSHKVLRLHAANAFIIGFILVYPDLDHPEGMCSLVLTPGHQAMLNEQHDNILIRLSDLGTLPWSHSEQGLKIHGPEGLELYCLENGEVHLAAGERLCYVEPLQASNESPSLQFS